MAEPQLKHFCDIAEQLLPRPVKCVVELGARDCAETLAFAKRFPTAEIYAFECNPDTLPLCRERIQDKPQIHLIEAAVSDESGPINFYQIDTQRTRTDYPGGNPGASSLFRSSGTYPLEDYVQKSITVGAVTLQDFFRKNKIESVDLLWMDIQGAELLALRGTGTDLSKIKLIHLEVEFFEIYKDQPLFGDIRSFFRQNDFAFFCFTQLGRYSGDAIFIRRDLNTRSRLSENMTLWRHLTPRKLKNLFS